MHEYEEVVAAGALRAGSPAAPALCAEVLAEGSAADGFHLYYTSGTTGTPKGVLLSHRIVVAHAVGTVKGGCWAAGGVAAAGVAAAGEGGERLPTACASLLSRSGTSPGSSEVTSNPRCALRAPCPLFPEMRLNRHDVWGHFAPMFHLVDVFAVYAITLVGGRHVTLPAFDPQQTLLAIGEDWVTGR